MKRIQPISKMPEHGATVAPGVKIAVIVNLLEAIAPLFTNKNPQNPVPTEPTVTEGEAEA